MPQRRAREPDSRIFTTKLTARSALDDPATVFPTAPKVVDKVSFLSMFGNT